MVLKGFLPKFQNNLGLFGIFQNSKKPRVFQNSKIPKKFGQVDMGKLIFFLEFWNFGKLEVFLEFDPKTSKNTRFFLEFHSKFQKKHSGF